MEEILNNLDKTQISALSFLLRHKNDKQLQTKLNLKEPQLQKLLDLQYLIEVPPTGNDRKHKYILPEDNNFQSQLKEFLDKQGITRGRTRTKGLDVDLLIDRLRGEFREILRNELRKGSSSPVMSFYEFANNCNKYVTRTMSYGNRLEFDKLFTGLNLTKNDEQLFKVYIKDLSLIYPDFIRLNPVSPGRHTSKVLLEIGGTKYDSIVIKTSLF